MGVGGSRLTGEFNRMPFLIVALEGFNGQVSFPADPQAHGDSDRPDDGTRHKFRLNEGATFYFTLHGSPEKQ